MEENGSVFFKVYLLCFESQESSAVSLSVSREILALGHSVGSCPAPMRLLWH